MDFPKYWDYDRIGYHDVWRLPFEWEIVTGIPASVLRCRRAKGYTGDRLFNPVLTHAESHRRPDYRRHGRSKLEVTSFECDGESFAMCGWCSK